MFGVDPNKTKNMQQRMMTQELDHDTRMNTMNQATPDDVYMAQQGEREDLTKWQQDLLDDLDRAVHTLKREVENEEGEWIPLGTYDDNGKLIPLPPMMNNKGIAYYKSQVMPCINKNLIMSNYKEDFIFTKLKSVVGTFIMNLGYNKDNYEIDDGDMSSVVTIFKSTIEPTFFRCLNAGERQANREMRKVIEAFSYGKQAQPQQKGMFGGLFNK